MAAHLSALVAVVGVPFGHVIGPLVVYLTQRERSPFAKSHAKASLNFQITVAVVAVVLIAVAVVGWIAFAVTMTPRDATLPALAIEALILTILTFAAGAIAVLVCVICGAVAASKGLPYRYPFEIDFIR